MPEDCGQPGFGLRDGQDASINDHLAARETEGIGLILPYDAYLPIKRFARVTGRCDEPIHNSLDHVDLRSLSLYLGLREHFLITLQAQGGFLTFGKRHTGGAASLRIYV